MSSNSEEDVLECSDDESPVLPPLLESLARGDKNVANMVLAYEISVNDNFQMTKLDTESTIQGQIKKTMEKAFWNILREQIREGNDEMVLGVIREIREQILNFLTSNSITQERIKAQLDMEIIEQQWVAGTFHLKELNNNILQILGQLCCPSRDQSVIIAKKEADHISQLSLITNLLRVMRLDMTNYAIRQIRPLVQKQHIQQQRDYFAKWAEGRGDEALQFTTKWIRNSVLELSRLDREIKPVSILQTAFVLSLTHADTHWPETLFNEKERIQLISAELQKQILIAAAFLIVAASVPHQYVIIKEQLKTSIQPIAEQTKFDELQFSVAELVIKHLQPFKLNNELIHVIRGQISTLNSNHSIYKLLWSRVSDFLGEIALPSKSTPPEPPKGLQNIQTELVQIASTFGKICGLNRLSFGPVYSKIIKCALEADTTPLSPRKTHQINDMAKTPDYSQNLVVSEEGKSGGLTPRKENFEK